MLERYQVVRELGSGAMAQVSLALDTRDRRLVALKRLHGLYAVSGGARMRREFRALERLDHPNIVRVYDHGEGEGLPFLALEFVDGVTLNTWLETPRTVPEILRVFVQVADALEAVHAAGLIHRDLKPENIMVTADGTAKLMDFGLTKLEDSSLKLTRFGAMVGTVLYMAPEQCRGAELDARADIYGLGAVLYRALAGVAPFTGNSLTAVVLQHLSAAPPPLAGVRSDLPAALEALVMQMLAKSPDGRPRSAREVAARLRSILEPGVAPVSSPPEARVRLLRAPLIGRAAELRGLEAALTGSVSGYVALIGEAGLGKSRLLEELSARTDLSGMSLVTASASASDTRAFAVIERLLTELKKETPAVWSALAPDARERLMALSAPLEGDAVAGAQRFEAFRTLLEAAAANSLLVFENLHWADTASLSMLAHGLRGAPRARVLVTYRPEDLGQERPRPLPEARVTLRLEPLSARHMRSLLEARLGGNTEAGLRDALLERAGGNPWALEELLRDMIGREAILEKSGVFEWDRHQAGAGFLEHTGLLEYLGARLAHLEPDPRAFAETGAVLGREFLFEDARALLGWIDDRALAALEALLSAKVLLERPSGDEFQFAHPEYVGWLEAQLEPGRSRAWHAAALERLGGRAPEFALAQHALRAEHFEQAFELGLRAGEAALSELHYSLAERAFRLALEANVEAPNPLERQARYGLAEALLAMGQPEDADLLWRALAEGADDLARRAKLQLAETHIDRNEFAAALKLLAGDDSITARFARARGALRAGEPRLAWREALAAYRMDPTQAEALLILANVTNITGEHERGLKLARAGQRRRGDALARLRGRNFEASALLGLKRYAEAQVIFEEVAEAAERIGHLWLQLSSLNNIAIILFYEDRIDETLIRYQQARALAKRAGQSDSEFIIATNVVESLVMLGRLEEALGLAQEYTHPTAQLWASYLSQLLGVPPLPLPLRESVSAWYQTLFDLTEAAVLLRRGDDAALLEQTRLPHEDYSWWWDLFELNLRLKFGLPHRETLERLKAPKPNPGLQRSLALEYGLLLEDWIAAREALPPHLAWLLRRDLR